MNGARYRKLIEIGEAGDCWNWLGSINPKTGYGKKQWFGESWLAHRWIWTMLFGTIERGMTIDHLCSNRKCVNPHHLEVVTQMENLHRGKGTKLTFEQIQEIRSLPVMRGDREAIAKKYGIHPSYVSQVRLNRKQGEG
jgi:hypothetical protein